MSERVTRIARKQAREAAKLVSQDEQLTRQRVDGLEQWAGNVGNVVTKHTVLLSRPFLGRLRWLLTGR